MNTIQRAYDPRLVREINPHHNHHTRSQPHATLQNPYLTKLRHEAPRADGSLRQNAAVLAALTGDRPLEIGPIADLDRLVPLA